MKSILNIIAFLSLVFGIVIAAKSPLGWFMVGSSFLFFGIVYFTRIMKSKLALTFIAVAVTLLVPETFWFFSVVGIVWLAASFIRNFKRLFSFSPNLDHVEFSHSNRVSKPSSCRSGIVNSSINNRNVEFGKTSNKNDSINPGSTDSLMGNGFMF